MAEACGFSCCISHMQGVIIPCSYFHVKIPSEWPYIFSFYDSSFEGAALFMYACAHCAASSHAIKALHAGMDHTIMKCNQLPNTSYLQAFEKRNDIKHNLSSFG